MSDNHLINEAAVEVADTAPPYLHITTQWASRIATLRRRMPRALCGVMIPARSDVGPDAERCPECLACNGGRPGDYFVPRPR